MFEKFWDWIFGPEFSVAKKLRTEVLSRDEYTDTEFLEKYFPDVCDQQRDIVLRVRKVVCTQFGVEVLVPKDSLTHMFPDIPFDEIVAELAEEFDFVVTTQELDRLSGSMRSLFELVLDKVKIESDQVARD